NDVDFVAYAASTYVEDVQLYNGPLSAPEVEYLLANPGQATATSAKAVRPANLVAHWKLDGASLTDSSANGITLQQDLGTAAPASTPYDASGAAVPKS